MKKIYISPSDKKVLETVLSGSYEVYVFGSRITGKHKQFSDLDICLKASNRLSASDIGQLREKLSDSPIPYKIDLVDYQQLSRGFKELIDQCAVLLSSTEPVL